jgi:hypothetical protein
MGPHGKEREGKGSGIQERRDGPLPLRAVLGCIPVSCCLTPATVTWPRPRVWLPPPPLFPLPLPLFVCSFLFFTFVWPPRVVRSSSFGFCVFSGHLIMPSWLDRCNFFFVTRVEGKRPAQCSGTRTPSSSAPGARARTRGPKMRIPSKEFRRGFRRRKGKEYISKIVVGQMPASPRQPDGFIQVLWKLLALQECLLYHSGRWTLQSLAVLGSIRMFLKRIPVERHVGVGN